MLTATRTAAGMPSRSSFSTVVQLGTTRVRESADSSVVCVSGPASRSTLAGVLLATPGSPRGGRCVELRLRVLSFASRVTVRLESTVWLRSTCLRTASRSTETFTSAPGM